MGQKRQTLAQILDSWLEEIHVHDPRSAAALTPWKRHAEKHTSYSLYSPLLLLPARFLESWPSDLNESNTRIFQTSLWQRLCMNFAVSHIALNAPIPSSNDTSLLDSAGLAVDIKANIQRRPLRLITLHGDFGPLLDARHDPSHGDFESAFWCSSRQNGIIQIWAPLYTMFSRGNISEKLRLFSQLQRHDEIGRCRARLSVAVDLYAGIGYFSYVYAKARFSQVLCWELNPWSVEGLARGASANNWTFSRINVSKTQEEMDYDKGNGPVTGSTAKFLIFQENNVNAPQRVKALRARLQPIRHVNCGLLPSSRASWEAALMCLDPHVGGWIHIHENVPKSDIERMTDEIIKELKAILGHSVQGSPKWRLACEHVETVKSYAPGVYHCVFDIFAGP